MQHLKVIIHSMKWSFLKIQDTEAKNSINREVHHETVGEHFTTVLPQLEAISKLSEFPAVGVNSSFETPFISCRLKRCSPETI